MRVGFIIAVLALVSFGAFRGCFGGASTSWNQRLTLVVETPQGEVRGSSVTKVSVVDFSGPLVLAEARGPKSSLQGEAVAVEVLPGKWLFALIGGAENPAGNAAAWAEVTYAPARDAANRSRGYWERVADIQRQPYDTPVPLPPESWPMLVTFDDITKPETVREVDPEDLAAVFGEGVRLKTVTLEITEEAVTAGRVEGVLGWMPDYQERPIIPIVDPMDFTLPAKLRAGDFIIRSSED